MEVNRALGSVAFTISLFAPVVWIAYSHWLVHKRDKCTYIQLIPKKNWHHFHFSSTPFMKPVAAESATKSPSVGVAIV